MLFLLQQQDQTVSFRRQAADHGAYHHSFKRASSSWVCLFVHVYWMTLPMSPPLLSWLVILWGSGYFPPGSSNQVTAQRWARQQVALGNLWPATCVETTAHHNHKKL